MKQTEIDIPEEYLSSLHINGMRGRCLSVPHKKSYKKKKSPEILFIYGHHSSLERMYSLVCNLNNYGNVTMPDLPGFGGMDSFYILKKQPSLDNMADYLATFIKLNYKNRRINIVGMSYGFLVITRMLQKYPSLAKKVDQVISVVGFSNYNDFTLKPKFYNSLIVGSKIGKTAPAGWLLKHLIITKPVINLTYKLVADNHSKLKDATKQQRAKRINFEVYLWKINDIRTYFYTTEEFLKIDLTSKSIDLPLNHIDVKDDQYFDTDMVLKNLDKIFSNVNGHTAKMPNHAPTVISEVKEAGRMFPASIKPILKSLK